MKRIKFWPHKEARTVIAEMDFGTLHVEYEFEDLDEVQEAFKDLADAINIVQEDWS